MNRHNAINDKAETKKEVLAQLLDTLDKLKDGILIIDGDYRITYANAEMSRLLFRQALTDKNIFEINLEEACPNVLKALRTALNEQKNISVIEYIKRVKAWYIVYIYPSPVFTSVVFKDRSVLERLDERYKLTHYTIENAREIVMWVTMEGRLAYANKATRAKLGYATSDKANYQIIDIIKSLPYQGWNAFKNEAVAKGNLTFESIIMGIHGNKFHGEVTANYAKFKEREYIVTFIRDITQRKQAEDELKASKAQAELYLDLMCHDINNINQVGIGFLELAMETEDITEPVKDYLDKTMESLHRSTDLITNVKKLQNSKSGSLQIRPVNLPDVIGKTVAQYSNPQGRDVSIHLKSAGECRVMANDLLKDVFDNLVGNAIKHSSGPLAIDIKIDRIREDGRDFYRIDVEDNGPGIPDFTKDVIFGRGDISRKRASGKGFGLYLVKTLVSDFKGGVWVEDRVPGDYRQGSRFVLMLPAARGVNGNTGQ